MNQKGGHIQIMTYSNTWKIKFLQLNLKGTWHFTAIRRVTKETAAQE